MGHRSSACKHTDRPLYEIKKKGRPVTQCEHCRELRKTKQVHVKCLCGQDPSGAGGEASNKKGTAKLPAVAAFPRGLPEDLEALAILPATSDGSIDSDHSGETSPSGCRCKKGGPCDCAVPRKSVARRRMSNHDVSKGDKHHLEIQPPLSKDSFPPLSSHVIARIAELRPVLPRPARSNAFPEGPIHDPSLGIPHGHGSRHHSHENMYYSPYGRAYEHSHTLDFTHKPTTPGGGVPTPIQPNSMPGIPPSIDSWQPPSGGSPSPCACGDSCRCPGCTQHNTAAVPPGGAYASCVNPATCSFCLDCTIFSFSANATLPVVDPTDLDEWVYTTPSTSSLGMQSTVSPYDLAVSQISSLPHSSDGPARSAQILAENHRRSCACPGNSCSCPSGTCQCGQSGDGPRSRTTFAVSGERGLCCDKPGGSTGVTIPHRPPRIPDYTSMTSMRNSPMGSSSTREMEYYPEQASYMSVPEVPSRSSSTSSTSSRLSRTSPISGNNPGIFHIGTYSRYDPYSNFNPTQFS
ncbi:hypothetical protein V8B97DRAFT_1490200 [Scleroderma yunnanense]